jgi:hypothetical protein
VWRPVLAAAAATLLLPVGLAVAGVSLPRAFEQPYRSVGVTLPHQTRDVPSPAKRPVTPPTPPTTRATTAPPRPAQKPARRPASGQGQRHRRKGQANPVDPAGRQDKPRGPRTPKPVTTAPGPKKHGPNQRPSTLRPHKPAASKPPGPKGRGPQRNPPRAGK